MDIHLFANGYREPTFSESKDFLSRSAAEAAALRRPGPWCDNPGTSSWCTPGMTWTGDILATIDVGATSTFFIDDESNIHGGLGDRTDCGMLLLISRFRLKIPPQCRNRRRSFYWIQDW
jgi:hypothetical protein